MIFLMINEFRFSIYENWKWEMERYLRWDREVGNPK